jgi:hypothetical protein
MFMRDEDPGGASATILFARKHAPATALIPQADVLHRADLLLRFPS